MTMNKHVKSTLVLVCICAVLAILLGLTNYITGPIIQENEEGKANAALTEVMPEGKLFDELDISEYTLPATVSAAYRETSGKGYVVKISTTGFSSGLVIMCGISSDGTVTGTKVIENTETPTYGGVTITKFESEGVLVGKGADTLDSVDTKTGATVTATAYVAAVKDAINAATNLSGGSADLRTEEEILQDNLSAALPSAEGEFEKLFLVARTEADAIYKAKNGTGFVAVAGELFVPSDAQGNITAEGIDAELSAKLSADISAVLSATAEAVDLTAYEGIHRWIKSVSKTNLGNYIVELEAAGHDVVCSAECGHGSEYHGSTGKYIKIKVSITAEGKVIDCLTVEQHESQKYGAACGNEDFYGQFDGTTKDTYQNIDGISGSTITTNAYKNAILYAFQCVEILEGGTE